MKKLLFNDILYKKIDKILIIITKFPILCFFAFKKLVRIVYIKSALKLAFDHIFYGFFVPKEKLLIARVKFIWYSTP